MKYNFTRCFVLLATLCCFFGLRGFSEGTKQLMPTNTGVEKIEASSPTTSTFGFAYYGSPVENRLNIHIKQVGETIYYGFRRSTSGGGSFQYRIKDPGGNIVVAATNLPTSGIGYITTYDQAVAGPNQIVTTGGYDALAFAPASTGDFYIEFSNTTTLLYFDITVADAANQPITGRVWSEAWQFDTGSTVPDDSHSVFYIYTDDGLVSKMNLNGLQGITFTVACNQMGCPNPSGVGYTRASVNYKHVLPQYKIFLNDPDITEYPTGTLGQLTNLVLTWNCDGSADIDFDVSQAGTVDVLLDIDPTPGQQPIDTVISKVVTKNHNTIHWNGENGLGGQVPNGTIFNITVTYIMGLTNFPMYDVEANPNGLLVSLVRPTASGELLVYWDDTGLTIRTGSNCSVNPAPTTSNTTGCNYLDNPCHTWVTTNGNPGQCSYGNENTVNQYWYAVFDTTDRP